MILERQGAFPWCLSNRELLSERSFFTFSNNIGQEMTETGKWEEEMGGGNWRKEMENSKGKHSCILRNLHFMKYHLS